MKQGQYIRLFLAYDNDPGDYAVIAAATDLSLHISATVEASTTKDDGDGLWVSNEVTGLSYDISSSALVVSEADDNDLNTVIGYFETDGDADTSHAWTIAEVSGDDNRTLGSIICSGQAIPTSLQVNAANRQNSTLSISLQGTGSISTT